jgi:hypothetical protein
MADLSNAPQPTNDISFTSEPFVPADQTPQAVINNQLLTTGEITTLQFPQEQLKYYMQLNISNYQSFTTGVSDIQINSSNITNSIFLPLPDALKDLQSVNWTRSDELAKAFAGVAGVAGGITAMLAGGAKNAIGQSIKAVGGATAAGGIASLVGQSVRLSGIAPNQFVTILLNGPEYKEHTFTWTLAPNNPNEAEVLRQIIQLLNNVMAPGMGGGGLYWNFPQIFQISFAPNPEYLFQFKPAVLTNFMVDYAAGHAPTFLRNDSNAHGENPPEAISVQAQFLEIEYWKNGDFTAFGQSLGNTGKNSTNTLIQTINGLISPTANVDSTVTAPLL